MLLTVNFNQEQLGEILSNSSDPIAVVIQKVRVRFSLEQRDIVGYVDKLLKNTRVIKERIRRQIETLKSYRKSLIHECVTGKKRVYHDS